MNEILKYFRHWPALLSGAAVAATFLVAIFSYQVKSTEVVLVKTLGRISVQDEPGIHLCWPFPVDQLYRFDKRIRCFDGYDGRLEETSTADNKTVVAGIYVAYRISDAEKLFRAAGNFPRAEFLLNKMMRSAKDSAIGAHSLHEFVNIEDGSVRLQNIEDEIRKGIAGEAMKNLGLTIEGVGFKTFIVPEKITEKVIARMKAERNVLSEFYRSDGKSEAKRIRDEADNTRNALIAQAESKAKIIRGEGDELAVKYYSVFRENPELAVFLRKLESIKRMKAGNLTLIINTEGSPFNVMTTGNSNFSGKAINNQ